MSKALYSLIYSYTSAALYTLSYIYSYILHIPAYFTPLLYTLLYNYYTLLYTLSFIYSLLLFSNNITNLAPPFLYLSSYILLSYILTSPPHFSPLSYIPSTTPHLIYCYTHSLIWKGYNYTAADFYTLYIAILIFCAALILHTLISWLFYTSLLKSGKGGGRNCRTPLKYRTIIRLL